MSSVYVSAALKFVAVGASLTATPVKALDPVTEDDPSLTLVATVKFELKFDAGVNTTAASNTFTSAIAPLAVQTPVPATYVEVTAPDVPVDNEPAAGFESVSVAVNEPPSVSLATISIRLSGVSSV